VFLSFVDPLLVRRHLGDQAVGRTEVARLLRHRAIPAGTPVFLDETSMRPVEPLCSWFRHLAYEDKSAKTLREYAYIVRRFSAFLWARGRELLAATESDLKAYQAWRTEDQDSPIGDAAWGKEAQLINQLYRWLVEYGHLRHRPLRVNRKGYNPMAPRSRRGMDIRHMTLAQYRYFRDVGLAGQRPDSRTNRAFRGRAPLRNRAAADLALSTGMRPLM
jgi:site-specific recombinase XerD